MTPSTREFPLPTELVELIVANISRDIARLRIAILVSRAFVHACRKHLYETITLLDDTDNLQLRYPLQRAERPPVFTEKSFSALLKEIPFIGHLVKDLRICASMASPNQELYVKSKHLPVILPYFSSLVSISFQRIKPTVRVPQRPSYRLEYPSLLMTSRLAKAIPPSVQSMELRHVKFQDATVVNELFSTCRRLTHLALCHVSILPEKQSLAHSVVSTTKNFWKTIFPSGPTLRLEAPSVELQSLIFGKEVYLLPLSEIGRRRLPFPFEMSSVTSLKVYGDRYWEAACWDSEAMIIDTVSTLQELVLGIEFSNLVRVQRRGLRDLSRHTRLRSLSLILMDAQTLFGISLPPQLEKLTLYVSLRRFAWDALDTYIGNHPVSASLSQVEILLHPHHHNCRTFICWYGSDDVEFENWKAEVITGLPILHGRGLLSVRQLKGERNDEPLP